jgi:hypothetical protein
MSRFSELRRRGTWHAAATLIGMVALGCAAATLTSEEGAGNAVTIGATPTQAGDDAKPSAGTGHATDGRQAAPDKAPKNARSLFRCWQDGRMVYEGKGYGPLPKSQVAAELKTGDNGAATVQVLDLYTGLCVLELPK